MDFDFDIARFWETHRNTILDLSRRVIIVILIIVG
jgi:hypothetical protein